jgi:hypothetical protein
MGALRCLVAGHVIACWRLLGALADLEWSVDWPCESDAICLEEITLVDV